MHTTTLKLAKAFKAGFKLAYGKAVRRETRQSFMETLDDMAVALTRKAVDKQEEDYKMSAWLLGSILEQIDESYRKPKKKRNHEKET